MYPHQNACRHALTFAAALILAGCANIHTVSRDTSAPWGQKQAKAIHLDAQQRIVVFAAERYCAEPSPDALAAYAAALGLTGSRLPKQSLAASAALNSAAGSIGLRTQSITLMRDTLYRTCEAAMNGYLSDEQVAILMARSQDLTAVVLAIEQLTGAVAAPPITLNTGGNSSAASTLLANAQAVAAARDTEAKAKATRDEAEGKRSSTFTALESSKLETQRLRQQATDDPTDANKQALAAQQTRQASDQAAFDTADDAFNQANKNHQLHLQTLEQISKVHDSSVNTTTAAVSSGANMGTTVYHSSLTDQSTQHISTTVKELVTLMLHKDYFADACMANLMKPSLTKRIEDRLSVKSTAGADAAWRGLSTQEQKALDAIKVNEASLTAVCLKYFEQFKPHHTPETTPPAK
jgi:hypothetical protein